MKMACKLTGIPDVVADAWIAVIHVGVDLATGKADVTYGAWYSEEARKAGESALMHNKMQVSLADDLVSAITKAASAAVAGQGG